VPTHWDHAGQPGRRAVFDKVGAVLPSVHHVAGLRRRSIATVGSAVLVAVALLAAACGGGDDDPGVTATTTTRPVPGTVAPTTGGPTTTVHDSGGATTVDAAIRSMDGFFAPFVLRPAVVGLDARSIAGDPTDLFELVDADRLEVDTRALSERRGPANPTGQENVAERMHNGLRDAGYRVETIEVTTGDRDEAGDGEAFAVRLPGTECASRVLVVTAHFDGPDTGPGAHAATGPAALLELARVLGEMRLPMTLLLVALPSGVEGPTSATDLVAHLEGEDGDEPIAAIALDGMGLRADEDDELLGLPGEYLLFVGERTSEYLARVFSVSTERFLPEFWAFTAVAPLDLYPEFDGRDAAAWWEAGRQALLVTDTGLRRDDLIGTGDDRPWRVDGEFLADGVRAVLAGLVGVATIDGDDDGVPDVCQRDW
jgi:hypothetical protein